MLFRGLRGLVCSGAIAVGIAHPAAAQLRMVTYNTAAQANAGLEDVFEAIGSESVRGISRPIDVLLLQEQFSSSTTTAQITTMLNALYGAGTYARATAHGGPSFSDIRQGLVYNTNTVTLLDQRAIGSTSSTGQPRQTLRYRLRPVGYDQNAEFYVYNSHYKASAADGLSNGTTNGARRLAEANLIRGDADGLGDGAHIIYGGDFNMSSSSEDAYQALLADGPGRAVDPISVSGTWKNNSSVARWHTQSPSDGTTPGHVTGGIDDRFDFLLTSSEFDDGEGLAYISGTYRTFGNNGSTFNDAVNDGNSIDLPPGVLDALATSSDHLPVVADFQLPAQAAVTVEPPPPVVLAGAAIPLDVTVENVADVAVPIGADELDYTISASGVVVGSASGSAPPLGGGETRQVTLVATGAGPRTGRIDVQTTSQGVPAADLSHDIDVTVLTHADGSFDGGGDVNLLALDFGEVAVGDDPATLDFSLHNLVHPNGFTSGLDLDGVVPAGDSDILTTDLATMSGIEAGDSRPFSATFAPHEAGEFTASYVLQLSDVDLPGSMTQLLTLVLTGTATLELLADFDRDRDVDGDDFLTWQNGFGQTAGATLEDGDADGDGDVDGEDFLLWQSEFGQSSGLGVAGASVPEPSGVAMAVLIVAFGGVGRRSRLRR